MTTEATTTEGFVLWHRQRRRHPWRVVAQAATSLELTALIGRTDKGIPRSGEWLTLRTGDHPDNQQGARPR